MDETTRPTAAELGISEAEYERILRGIATREVRDPAATFAPAGRTTEPPPPRSVRTWLSYGVVGLAVLVALLRWQYGGDREPAYAFQDMTGDHPVTYSACRPIFVAVYPAGGPPNALEMVEDAVAEIRIASGFDIKVSGAFGGRAPNWDFGSAPLTPTDPVSVSWQDGDAIRAMTDHVAGLGGSREMTRPGGMVRLFAGTVALSRDYYREIDYAEGRAVIMHELGHVLGLAHVDSPDEIMNPVVGKTELGPGDREGLAKLGQVPCT